jgi:sarcosine oxidase
MAAKKSYDVAVIGAGVFGSWTAQFLNRAGLRVILVDEYGPASNRASSGGESRIIRMGYGPDEIYTRWSMHALPMWIELFARTNNPLFHRTGVLWIAPPADAYAAATAATLEKVGAKFLKVSHHDLRKRYPQIAVDNNAEGILEPDSGVLMARRAVQAVVDDAVHHGVEYLTAAIAAPNGRGRLGDIKTIDGTTLSAGKFVFACGPWLPRVFPNVLGGRIFASRQEVFFFGLPAGDLRFSPPALPTWLILADEYYGMPSLENRGFKVAFDRHGAAVDPDTMNRIASEEGLRAARAYVARRFPALKDAPLEESRVCQYENTSNGDFLVDRHPDLDNVWLVGGGSGHGFKHGPSMGEYVAAQVTGSGTAEPRFSLASKQTVQHRAVY